MLTLCGAYIMWYKTGVNGCQGDPYLSDIQIELITRYLPPYLSPSRVSAAIRWYSFSKSFADEEAILEDMTPVPTHTHTCYSYDILVVVVSASWVVWQMEKNK